MKYIVQLERQGWVSLEKAGHKVFVRGQAHIGDVFFDAAQLAAKLLNAETRDSVITIINQLNGTWAFVWLKGEEAVFSVDHIRSIELLYHFNKHEKACYVFDDLTRYLKGRDFEFEEDVIHEYLSSGFAWRYKTLVKDVFSIQAGEFVIVNEGHIVRSDFFIPYPNLSKKKIPTDSIINKIDDTFCRVVKRLIESVNGRRIVIPLSGGYDSRLIVNYLCKLGYKNIICYTYGAKNNLDSEFSKNVANALDLPWYFVEYKGNLFLEEVDSQEVNEFCRFACNGTNTPILQEFYAIKNLKERGIITEDDVIVPGHSFDAYAGAYQSKACYPWCVASEIYGTSVKMFYGTAYGNTIRDLRDYVNENKRHSVKDAFEIFSLREHMTKAIFNAVRVCEWFGIEWRIPWTDKELTEEWLDIPWCMKYGREWFRMDVAPRLWVEEIRSLPLYGYWETKKLNPIKKSIKRIKEHIPFFMIRLLRGGHSINRKSLGKEVFNIWTSTKVKKMKEKCLNELNSRRIDSVIHRINLNFEKSSWGGSTRVLYVFVALVSILLIPSKSK